jgi:hypothetical protein
MTKLSIPPTLLRSFELVPEDAHAVLLLRHAHRRPIRAGTYGNEVPLTQKGIALAQAGYGAEPESAWSAPDEPDTPMRRYGPGPCPGSGLACGARP